MKKLTYLSLVGVMGLIMSCGGNTESEVPADVEPVVEDTLAVPAPVETPVETTTEATE